jgi:hypothetical protein
MTIVGRPRKVDVRTGLTMVAVLEELAGRSAIIQSSRRSSRVAATTVPCGSTMNRDSYTR